MSIAAMSVICACLLVMGSFTLVALNIDNMLADVENKNEIVVYVDETYTEEQARAIESKLVAIPEVAEVKFTTKVEAFENYKAEFGEEAELLAGLEDRNPLRDRYTVKLNKIEDTKTAEQALSEVEGIAKVSARSDISDKIMQVRDSVTAICWILILVLAFVSVFIISNTVNLTMFNRREEIAIMKMIGATNSFVRIPFVIEGLLIGIAGAAVALFLQWCVYEYVVVGALSTISFISTVSFGSVFWLIAAMFFGVGIIVGGIGSAITLHKFLKV